MVEAASRVVKQLPSGEVISGRIRCGADGYRPGKNNEPRTFFVVPGKLLLPNFNLYEKCYGNVFLQ